jgi:PAS domain S-box-containing protein
MTKKTLETETTIIGIYTQGLRVLHDFLLNYGAPLENLALVVTHHLAADSVAELLQLLRPHADMKLLEAVDNLTLLSNAIYIAPENQKIAIAEGKILWLDTSITKIQENLRNSVERFNLAVQGSSDGIWDWNVQEDLAYFSPRFRELVGYKSKEYIAGMAAMKQITHPDDFPHAVAVLESHLQQRTPYSVEYRLLTANNEYRWFLVRGQAIWNEQGVPIRMAGSLTDIHDRKVFEKKLLHTEQNLNVAQRLAHIGDWEMNLLEDKLSWSDEVYHIFGLEPQEFEANYQAYLSHIHPDDQEYVNQTYTTSLKERSSYHIFHRIVALNGIVKQVECHGKSFYNAEGVPTHSIGTIQDISQLKEVENALKHTLKLQMLEQKILELSVRHESKLEHILAFYLKELESIFDGMHCSILKLEGDRLYHWFSLSLPQKYQDAIEGILIGPQVGSCGTAAFTKQKVIVTDIENDSTWVNFKDIALEFGLRSCWSYPIMDSNNQVIGTFAFYYKEPKVPTQEEEDAIERAKNILQIIIENKAFEKALLSTNELYTSVTQATSDAIWDWDIKNNEVLWNEAFQSNFGYSEDDCEIFSLWSDNLHPEDAPAVVSNIFAAIEGNDRIWNAEYRFKKANGVYINIRDKGFIIRDQAGKSVRMVGAMLDITPEINEATSLQKIAKEKEIWYSLLQAISGNKNFEEGLKDCLHQLCLYLECPYGETWFMNLDKTRMLYRVRYYQNERVKLMRGEKSMRYHTEGLGLVGNTMAQKELIYWTDIPNSPLLRKDYAEIAGISACVGMPIFFNDEIVALFTFFSDKPFDEDKLKSNLFENISKQFGSYIQKYKSDNELNRFFELSPVFLAISGADGRLKKVNSFLIEKTGYSEKELLNRKILDFVHPDDFEKTKKEISKIYEGQSTHLFENRMVTKSGESMWFEWSGTPIIEEGLTYAVAKDITERKAIQEERLLLIEQLKKSNVELKQFSYITSHNLRSPLTNMVGVFDLLDLSSIHDEEVLALLEILKTSTYNLNEVLNDLISILIIKEQTHLQTSCVSFQAIFERIAQSIGLLIERSGTKIDTNFSAAAAVNFNSGYLESIFLNLITNSIKYAKPGECPQIRIYSKVAKGKTKLVFEDQGLGFDLQKVGDRIFGLYQKFHSHKDSRGIGLYLVHTQITSLGGSIAVKSQENQGAKFTITFKD